MKIAITGASGKTGYRITEEALKKGIKVKQIVRKNSKVRENIKNRDHALFASYGPIPNPNLVVVVIIENGESGSAVAAPIAQQLIEEYQLNIHNNE